MTRGHRPEHPFPALARASWPSSQSNAFLPILGASPAIEQGLVDMSCRGKTPAYRRFSNLIRQGARVLLDLTSGECVLYSCANGMRMIARLTIRTLSQLVKRGDLVMAARENSWVHFAHPAANLAWFRPED